MIDGREAAEQEQARRQLERRAGETGANRGEADADKKHAHHAVAAPLIGKPARRQREDAEGKEARRRIFQKISVAEAPLAAERQRRNRGENKREQMIHKVADVEQKEM